MNEKLKKLFLYTFLVGGYNCVLFKSSFNLDKFRNNVFNLAPNAYYKLKSIYKLTSFESFKSIVRQKPASWIQKYKLHIIIIIIVMSILVLIAVYLISSVGQQPTSGSLTEGGAESLTEEEEEAGSSLTQEVKPEGARSLTQEGQEGAGLGLLTEQGAGATSPRNKGTTLRSTPPKARGPISGGATRGFSGASSSLGFLPPSSRSQPSSTVGLLPYSSSYSSSRPVAKASQLSSQRLNTFDGAVNATMSFVNRAFNTAISKF